MIFVSSWDDGHPLDTRLAEMYARRGLSTTFFVPLSNCEGLPVLEPDALRAIDRAGFEIGSHTQQHRYLDQLPWAEAKQQVALGKTGLEQLLGHEVKGFCYPGGKRPKDYETLLQSAGIDYARTVENLRHDRSFTRYDIPTTLQYYPHRRRVLLRNAIRQPDQLLGKLNLLMQGVNLHSLPVAATSLMETMAETDNVFHLWGHSWEVDRLNAWRELGALLDRVCELGAEVLTVGQLVERLFPQRQWALCA